MCVRVVPRFAEYPDGTVSTSWVPLPKETMQSCGTTWPEARPAEKINDSEESVYFFADGLDRQACAETGSGGPAG